MPELSAHQAQVLPPTTHYQALGVMRLSPSPEFVDFIVGVNVCVVSFQCGWFPLLSEGDGVVTSFMINKVFVVQVGFLVAREGMVL